MNKKEQKKPCNIERQDRISKVTQWLIDGHNSRSIIDLCKKEFKVESRAVYTYLEEAREQVKAVTPEQKNYYRNLAVERFNNIYQRALADEKYQVAINAQVEMNKTLGLYEPETNDKLGVNITYVKAD